MWFGISDSRSAKGKWVEHDIKDPEHATAVTYRWALGWERHPCGILS